MNYVKSIISRDLEYILTWTEVRIPNYYTKNPPYLYDGFFCMKFNGFGFT